MKELKKRSDVTLTNLSLKDMLEREIISTVLQKLTRFSVRHKTKNVEHSNYKLIQFQTLHLVRLTKKFGSACSFCLLNGLCLPTPKFQIVTPCHVILKCILSLPKYLCTQQEQRENLFNFNIYQIFILKLWSFLKL